MIDWQEFYVLDHGVNDLMEDLEDLQLNGSVEETDLTTRCDEGII